MEKDPNGKSPHESGAKLDAGKPRMTLVLGGFAQALIEVAKVGTFGANKYTDNGWMEVPNGIERYGDAEMRHQLTELKGEMYDPDSKLLHAAHGAWNALARLELIIRDMATPVAANDEAAAVPVKQETPIASRDQAVRKALDELIKRNEPKADRPLPLPQVYVDPAFQKTIPVSQQREPIRMDVEPRWAMQGARFGGLE